MSSRDGDRREARFVAPCASGVSTALWPVCEHRRVATSWLAQQRRSFIIRGIEPAHILFCLSQRLRLLYPLLFIVLSLVALVLATVIFQYWVILFVLATAWSMLVVLLTRLLCDRFYALLVTRLERRGRPRRSRSFSFSSRFPETPMPAAPLIRVLETIDLSTMDVEHFIKNESDLQTSTRISAVQKQEAHSADISP